MELQKQQIPLPVRLVISQEKGKHILEIRKKICDLDLIKGIILCAFYDQPCVIQPIFTNRLRSIDTLIKKGVITYNVNKDKSICYEFLI